MDEGTTSSAFGACGAANTATAAFCSSYGASLQRVCPACGAQVTESSVFCSTCGTRLSSAEEPPPPGLEERKVVSVLFADLEASTELATRLDPEELRAVYAPYFDALSGAIERFGGEAHRCGGASSARAASGSGNGRRSTDLARRSGHRGGNGGSG